MTFDEAIDLINEISYKDAADVWFEKEDLFSLINDLREEYSPTVYMTSGKAKTILDPEECENLTTLLTGKTPYFDYLFWEPLTDKQVAQAWLHPETIKVVDE